MSDAILVTRDGPIATVTLNHPERMNALGKAMWKALGKAIAALAADDDLRCIVLRGAGTRAFSAGADISEFATERADAMRARAYNAVVEETLATLAACRHPTIALIQGACVGGGLETAAFCDLRICGRSSTFGVPIKRLGLVMGHAELKGLVGLVGKAATLEILLEGRVFGAARAYDMGLVNRVVEDDAVAAETYATARRVAEGAPLVARWHKAFLRRLDDPAPLTEAERDQAVACYETEDYRIGARAFLAKETPRFEGR